MSNNKIIKFNFYDKGNIIMEKNYSHINANEKINLEEDAIPFLQPKGVENISELGLSFSNAISELIDNSIDAKSTDILIVLDKSDSQIDILILDNGCGMDKKTLQYSLSFGGEDGDITKKQSDDIGKFHAGINIASMTLSGHTEILTNNGLGWIKNYIDVEEIKSTKCIPASKECVLPEKFTVLLDDIKEESGLEISIDTGTIVCSKNIYKRMISQDNFHLEIKELYDNLCIRYHNYLADGNSIYIKSNTMREVKKCRAIHPLLKDQQLLEESNISIAANFKYRNILNVKEILPFVDKDASMDIEFVILKKNNKYDKMANAENLVKINEKNQGYYIDRNGLNIIRAQVIGGSVKHPSLNAVRAYSNLNGDWDIVLGINLNKSATNVNSKFYELLNKRVKKIYGHLRRVLRGAVDLEPPVIKLPKGNVCIPEVIINNMNGCDNEVNIDNLLGDNIEEQQETTESTKELDSNYNLVNNKSRKTFEINQNLINNSLYNLNIDEPIIFAPRNINKQNEKLAREFCENQSYYIYNEKISNLGIRKMDIEDWLRKNKITEDEFYKNIKDSLEEDRYEKNKFYEFYMDNFYSDTRRDFFLFPNVYIDLGINRQHFTKSMCVDFLLILPNKQKLVILIDDDSYAIRKTYKYNFDRSMLLNGYSVVRFTNNEINSEINMVKEFINEYLNKIMYTI